MPATCLHGLPPAECLICRTLGAVPAPASGQPARAEGRGRRLFGTGSDSRPAVPAQPVAGPGRTGEPDGGPHPARHWGLPHVVATLALIVAIGVVAWMLVGVAFALFHVLELVVVAGVAGWTGYRLGLYRGRRGR